MPPPSRRSRSSSRLMTLRCSNPTTIDTEKTSSCSPLASSERRSMMTFYGRKTAPVVAEKQHCRKPGWSCTAVAHPKSPCGQQWYKSIVFYLYPAGSKSLFASSGQKTFSPCNGFTLGVANVPSTCASSVPWRGCQKRRPGTSLASTAWTLSALLR